MVGSSGTDKAVILNIQLLPQLNPAAISSQYSWGDRHYFLLCAEFFDRARLYLLY